MSNAFFGVREKPCGWKKIPREAVRERPLVCIMLHFWQEHASGAAGGGGGGLAVQFVKKIYNLSLGIYKVCSGHGAAGGHGRGHGGGRWQRGRQRHALAKSATLCKSRSCRSRTASRGIFFQPQGFSRTLKSAFDTAPCVRGAGAGLLLNLFFWVCHRVEEDTRDGRSRGLC